VTGAPRIAFVVAVAENGVIGTAGRVAADHLRRFRK
jgi:hypothetical protein